MAVDTARKRASAVRFGQVWAGVLPLPNGSVDQFARQVALVMYGGILAGEFVQPETPTIRPSGFIDWDRLRRLEDDDLLAVAVGFLIASRNIR